MTELEKTRRAKAYMDMLANGIDPITQAELPDDSALNNVRLSRCFFYVSGILQKVIDNSGRVSGRRRGGNAPFWLTQEARAAFPYSSNPMKITELVEAINDQADSETMERLPRTAVVDWLLANGYLCEVEEENHRKSRQPTLKGEALGIRSELHHSARGEYVLVLYEENAQRFVVENIDSILDEYRGVAERP